MKLLISLGCGLFGLSALMMCVMAYIFAMGALQAPNSPEITSFKTALSYLMLAVPVIGLGLHIYGQWIWWSKDHESVWLPVLCMLSGFPAILIVIALGFAILPK